MSEQRDPFKDKLRAVPWECSHGNEDRCECQLPVYEGLYVAPIMRGHDNKIHHVIVWIQQSHDGGMWEFHDPATDETVGSCGIHWGYTNVQPLEQYMASHAAYFPKA